MKTPLHRCADLMRPAAFAAGLLLASGVAMAQQNLRDTDQVDMTPSAGAMAFDLVVVRPLSLVATVIGSGVFLLQLPIDLVGGISPSAPAEKLVVEPARYTFSRPLGAMEQ